MSSALLRGDGVTVESEVAGILTATGPCHSKSPGQSAFTTHRSTHRLPWHAASHFVSGESRSNILHLSQLEP